MAILTFEEFLNEASKTNDDAGRSSKTPEEIKKNKAKMKKYMSNLKKNPPAPIEYDDEGEPIGFDPKKQKHPF